jgi:hypothetical protein
MEKFAVEISVIYGQNMDVPADEILKIIKKHNAEIKKEANACIGLTPSS